MNAPTFRIFVDGKEAVFTEANAKVKFVSLGAEFKAADDAFAAAKDTHLSRAVVFGAYMLQLQQHLPWARLVAWSKSELGISHTQKLYSAMDLAEKYAEEKGVLDEPRLVAAIRSFNANCTARGLKPLDERSRSIRTAEIAAGLRPGIPDRRLMMTTPRTGEKNASGAPEGKTSPVPAGLRVDIFDGPDVLDLHMKPVEPRGFGVVGGLAGVGVGGQQTTTSSVLLNRRAAEVNGGGSDSASFLRPGRESGAGVSPASHGLPPSLECRQRVQSSSVQGNAAAPAGMRETSRPAVGGGMSQGGQASRHLGIQASIDPAPKAVQLTLAGEYELAAKKATLLVERIASGHASPEIVRKLIALCEEAERGEMAAGGGR